MSEIVPQDVPQKQCSSCKQFFPATVDYFPRRRSYCYVCKRQKDKEYRQAHRDERLAYQKEYYQDHLEMIRERCKKYRQEHLLEISERHKTYYQEHREEMAAQKREYYQRRRDYLLERCQSYNKAHPEVSRRSTRRYRQLHRAEFLEKHKARQRLYYAAHRDEHSQYMKRYRNTLHGRMVIRTLISKRRARKISAAGSHTAQQLLDQKKRQHSRCYYCSVKLGTLYHADHVVPLSLGGSDDISNIVITCPTCNLRKSNKLPHEWSEGGRLL